MVYKLISLSKTFLKLLLIFSAVSTIKGVSHNEIQTLFDDLLKEKHEVKNYLGAELRYRFSVFENNIKSIVQSTDPHSHHRLKKETLSMGKNVVTGVNKFSLMTQKEFAQMYLIAPGVLENQKSYLKYRNNPLYNFENFFKKMQNNVNKKLNEIHALDEEFKKNFKEKMKNVANCKNLNKIKIIIIIYKFFLRCIINDLIKKDVKNKTSGNNFFSQFRQNQRNLQQSNWVPGLKNEISWMHLFNGVVNQGSCNSCYISSTLGAIEGLHKKKYGQFISLSMQEIVDCSRNDKGCVGGQPSSVAQYCNMYGIDFTRNYKYTQKKGSCRAQYRFNKSSKRYRRRLLQSSNSDNQNNVSSQNRLLQWWNQPYNTNQWQGNFPMYSPKPRGPVIVSSKMVYDVVKLQFYKIVTYSNKTTAFLNLQNQPYTPGQKVTIPKDPQTLNHSSSQSKYVQGHRYEEVRGHYFVGKNVIEVMKALKYGPVVVAHKAPKNFSFYAEGVIDAKACPTNISIKDIDHSTTVVGYNLNAPVPYFKLRNSWDDDWGEHGYYRLAIGPLTYSNTGSCMMAGTPFMIIPYLK